MSKSNGVTLITPEFRVAFPKVFKAERNELNGNDEFSLVALFPKDADLAAMKAAIREAAVLKFGDKLPTNLRSPLRDGEEKRREDGSIPAGYEDAFFVNMKCQKRPGIVDASLQDIIDDAEFYGGCYARAQVHICGYDQKGNKGVGIYLNNIQKLRDGDAFGKGRVSAAEAFEPVAGATASASKAATGADIFV